MKVDQYPLPNLPPGRKGTERKELALWASLAKVPDCRAGLSPLGENERESKY
jgi:hypothetical protein